MPQGGPSLNVERLSLEIAVMPLLQGQIQVLEAVIEGTYVTGSAPRG
jgi:uncharacterized protein involved in outer membrane biogenesis